MLSWVWLLTKELLADSCFWGTALLRSSRSVFTVVLMLPKATTAFFPLISSTSPTELCPLIRTGHPSVMGVALGVCWTAGCSLVPFCFFSFLRFCFSFSFSIFRAILSSCSLEVRLSIDSRKSASSWRTRRVFSFSACASFMVRMVFSIRAFDSCNNRSASSFAWRMISFLDFCNSSISAW